MTPRTARTFLLLTVALATSTARAGALVSFRPTANVTEGIVTLGDVADIRHADPAVVQRLTAIIVGPAPDAGREATISFEAVRSRLMAAGVGLADVEFSGASSITVKGESPAGAAPAAKKPRTVPADARQRAERAAAAAVRRHLSSRVGAASIAVAAEVAENDVADLARAETQGFEVSGGAAPWFGRQTFTLRFLDPAERVREGRVDCVVSQRPSVLAARYALPKGQVLRPDDLVWKKSEFDTAGATDPAQLLGRETQQALRAGQPIPPDAVRAIPLVRNGQFVTVTSRRGGISARRLMKAKGDGAAGEVIATLTLEDHRTVMARVTGLDEAEVVDSAGPGAAEQPIDSSTITDEHGAAADREATEGARTEAATSDAPRVLVNPSQPLSVPAGSVGG